MVLGITLTYEEYYQIWSGVQQNHCYKSYFVKKRNQMKKKLISKVMPPRHLSITHNHFILLESAKGYYI